MSQALSEEEKQYVQRFDTPEIRDFNFAPDSANSAMPFQTGPGALPEPAPVSNAGEPTAGAPVAASAVQPENPESPAAGHTAETIPDVTPIGLTQPPVSAELLDPTFIPKFVNQLVKPPVCHPVSCVDDEYVYAIDIIQFKQQILPEGFPETTVWGYGGNVMDEETYLFRYDKSTPGATFEAVRNMPVRIRWTNKLDGPHLMTADPAYHQENAHEGSVPAVTHLHGARISQALNGNPDAWITSDGRTGPAYGMPFCTYPNTQDAAALWYHDNTRGFSRANIYAGLAGFYLLRSGVEFGWQRDGILPRGRYEIPLMIQDRSFKKDGSLVFARVGEKPFRKNTAFLGDSITVNGKVWPNLNVERRQYRFRLLNGSGARVYNLRMSNGMAFTQIGADNGFLHEPRTAESLRLAPGESADILIDFSGIEPAAQIILTNDARSPFPGNDASDPETTGQIMQFTVPVGAPEPVKPERLPPLPCRVTRDRNGQWS
ncbi:MAG: hypothetical protein GXY05_13255 [Clostridiales bacterium]|nr:hypothetical protein [Clostridiales bacterium]